MQLMGTHSLLASAEKVNRQKPFAQRNVAILKDRANRDRELLAASSTLPNALADVGFPCGFWLEFEGFADHATMRANRTIRPSLVFEESAGCVFVAEVNCNIY
jgi:hypothetical protein